mmetsp:Transcript_10797/g.17288  ORF Transcript_10797/g.17288 Transcript_10797/m.17288 type:complete len:161 (+) Transcript_10797:189-671(+)
MQIRSPLTTGHTKGGFKSAEGTAFTRVKASDLGGTGAAAVANSMEKRGARRMAVNPCGGGRAGDLAELVGIARVPKVSGPWDWLMNALLLLPTDALAVLQCRLRVWNPELESTNGSRRMSVSKAGTGEKVDALATKEEETAIIAALDERFEEEVTQAQRR